MQRTSICHSSNDLMNKCWFTFLVAFGCCLPLASRSAFADEKVPAYGAAGAPANPKVDVRWNRYHDYAQATALLKKIAQTYPEQVRL